MGGTSGIVAWKDRVMYVNLDTMRLVHDILGTCHVNRKTTQVAISVKYTRPRFENTNFFRADNWAWRREWQCLLSDCLQWQVDASSSSI